MPDKEQINYSTLEFLKDVLNRIKPYRLRFFFASLLRLTGDVTWLYFAYGSAKIVTFLTKYNQGDSIQPLINTIILLGLTVCVRNLCEFLGKFLAYQIAESASIDAQKETINHLFKLDMSWHEKENSGNKLKKIERGGDGFNKVLRMWINNVIQISVNFIGIIWIISRFDRLVSLLVLIFMVTFYAISMTFSRFTYKAIQKVNRQEEVVNGLLFEIINNIRTVKVMDMIPSLARQISSEFSDLFGKIKNRIIRYQSRFVVLQFWGRFFMVGIIAVIVLGILKGQYQVGFLVLFTGYFGSVWMSVSELSDISQDVVTAKLGIARMKQILKEPVTIDQEMGKQSVSSNWKTITFKNISFAYGENKVLKDISFKIKRGERIGVVGLSGAGKSTIFKLLLKENESYEGNILIDGISLRDISKRDYYRRISVVLQDTEVFNFTLRENINVVNPNESGNEKLFDQSLHIAHVNEFLSKLPDGVETLIGEKGVKLSGGEKQRLGIARAIFKQPEILLLDEATSHLDLESEEKIRDSLHHFFQSVTAIVIAHRLTTIKEMDRILVIENGEIIESGTFDQLYKKEGRFHELWEKQRL